MKSLRKVIREQIQNLLTEDDTKDSMKEFVIQALDNAIPALERRVSKTKTQVGSVSIENVDPIDIPSFMEREGIPNDAYFSMRTLENDGYDDILLCWHIEVPTTEEDQLKDRRRLFNSIAFKHLFDLLISNGYKRVGFGSDLLKQFDDTTVYDMYINKDFDRLVKYYSLSFKRN